MPSMAGPLSTAIPHEIAAGPFGKLEVTGILSGMGWSQGNAVAGDPDSHWDVSNAQIFIQKTTGWFQFYLQGGAYNLPALGTPFLSTGDTVRHLYGPFPQGYAKLVKGNFNVEIGALPTLIGAEYTFTFENMNIDRGLLWNQENAVNRGIQLNYTHKKLTAAFSWNDGFYSNRYTWLTGSLTYAFNAANTLAFVGGGNAGTYAKSTLATPLTLNNEQIYNIIYTYTKGHWVIIPTINTPTYPPTRVLEYLRALRRVEAHCWPLTVSSTEFRWQSGQNIFRATEAFQMARSTCCMGRAAARSPSPSPRPTLKTRSSCAETLPLFTLPVPRRASLSVRPVLTITNRVAYWKRASCFEDAGGQSRIWRPWV